MTEPTANLYCHCRYAGLLDDGARRAAVGRLAASTDCFHVTADLCELAARRGDELREMAEGNSVRVWACHARAVAGLLAAVGVDTRDAETVNLRHGQTQPHDPPPESGATGGSPASAVIESNDTGGQAASGTPNPSASGRIVLYEGPGARRLGDDERTDLLLALADAGLTLQWTRSIEALPRGDAPVLIVAAVTDPDVEDEAFPHELFDPIRKRLPHATDHVTFESARGCCTENVVMRVLARALAIGAIDGGDWFPWYPVIDYDRCTHCRQCLSFCLFSVFAAREGHRIEVVNPANCKTDCPACARVCPEAAIIFPKYEKGPIAGEPVTDEAVSREAVAADVNALMQGNLIETLKRRTAGRRFSTTRDTDRAEQERCDCIERLRDTLGIPQSVLDKLSPDELMGMESKARRHEGT